MKLSGRIALVAGGASGIGRATALRLASEGSFVAVTDTDVDAARRVEGEIAALNAGSGMALEADLTIEEQVEEATSRIQQAIGPIDILVNSAIRQPHQDLLTTPRDGWDLDIEIGLTAVWLTMRSVIPHMIHAGGGSIINVTSVNAHGFFGNDAYSAAKAAVSSLTCSAAVRYGPHDVRVNAVAPGTVQGTASWERRVARDSRMKERLEQWYPLRRIGTPDDVARAVTFLASDDAAWITGTTLRVDGGLLAGNTMMSRDL